MRRVGQLLVLVGLVLTGCEKGTTYAFPPASERPAATVSGSAAWAIAPPPDSAVVKLAMDTVNGCPFSEGTFGDCPALRKWQGARTNAFKGRRADATLVDLLGSADERMRVLAAQRKYWDEPAILASRDAAEKIIGYAERAETNPLVRARLLDDVMKFDFAKLGLMERLKTFVSRADVLIRQEIPAKFLRTSELRAPIPDGALDLVGSLLHDPEPAVRQAAFRELVTSAADPSLTRPVCKILVDALDPSLAVTDDLIASFSGIAACTDSPPRFVDRIELALKTPKTVSDDASRMYPNVLRGICAGGASFTEADAVTKKRAFDLAKTIAKTKAFDVYAVRAIAIDALVACDPTGAPAVLQKLMQDPDPTVDQLAKEAYDRLVGLSYEY